MENTIVFFDDYMLKSYSGVRKRFFRAEKYTEMRPEKPNEIGGRILYDTQNKVYRLWRINIDISTDEAKELVLYESEDLIHWEKKPEYGIYAEDMSAGFIKSFVTRDLFEPDPEKRYKSGYAIRNKDATGSGHVATSDDGLKWDIHEEYKFCDYISDTGNNVFYNPVYNEYQVILRGEFIDRRIFSKTSKDLINWSKARCLMAPNPDDEPCTEYYGMIVFPQNGYFLGLLWKYLPPIFDTTSIKSAGKADTYLVYSYDGNCWNHVCNTPIVERPLPPAYGSTGIYLSSLDECPDQVSWILSGDIRRVDHGCGFKPANPESELPSLAKKEGISATGVYRIRKEGFVALESIANEADITFKRIVLNGDDLFFNICAPLGWVKFQIRDENSVLPGYSFDDCIPFADDDQIRYRPRWKTRDLKDIKGRSITIEIMMNTALIFSVTGDFHTHTGYRPTISLGNMVYPD